MTVRTVGKDAEAQLVSRLNAYIGNGAPARVVAAECGVNWGLFNHMTGGTSKKAMTDLTHRKLAAWLDSHDEYMPDDYRRCGKCGEVKPLSEFHKDKSRAKGHGYRCADCVKEYQREHASQKRREAKMANNNTEAAITAEIVRKVKAEDKADVPPAMLAPYFGITPKQLEAVRDSEWDSLLVQVKKPEPAVSVQSAVEALRDEIAEMHTKLNVMMAELGCDGKQVSK